MTCQVNWIANRSASCFHAAAALAAGHRPLDERVAAALAPPVERLAVFFNHYHLPAQEVFGHLIAIAPAAEAHRQQASRALTRLVGAGRAESLIDSLAAHLEVLKHAYQQAMPNVLDDLELRSGPLREQWEARGPGMLHGIARLTEQELIPERVDVLVVSPVLGGAGRAHLLYNSISIEAMLANPVAELPEPARLGWLISQVQGELPRFSEPLPPARVAQLMPLAMLPAALAAAADVEWSPGVDRFLTQACQRWLIDEPDPAAKAATLATWWQTYCGQRPPWRAALLALDRMLQQRSQGTPAVDRQPENNTAQSS